MRIIAFDLSLSCCGWASTYSGSGTFKPKGRGMQRLDWVLDRVCDLEAYECDLVVVEGYSFNSRSSQAHALGELGGLVRYAIWEHGVPCVDVPPANLKKFATGKGSASKDLVLVEAVKRLGYEGSSNDEADALWLLNMARVHYGIEGAPQLPKTHLAALEKVQWPELRPPLRAA